MSDSSFRPFLLERDGATVAYGVVFPDGVVASHWREPSLSPSPFFVAIDLESAMESYAEAGAHLLWLDEQAVSLPTGARLFHLQRDVDETGVSGAGHVADGVRWADGTVTLRWLGPYASTVIWQSLDHAMAVHGHDGKSRIVWAGTEAEIRADERRKVLAELAPLAAEHGLVLRLHEDGPSV